MRHTKHARWAIVLLLLGIVTVMRANESANDAVGAADPDANLAANDDVRHGKYLAHDVAMCVQCHTPRHDDGTLDRRRPFAGAPVPIKSPFVDQQWATRAPSLVGLPGGWNEEKLVHFLRTGETPTRHPIQPPMPPFRLTERDARAIAAYLKSLGPK